MKIRLFLLIIFTIYVGPVGATIINVPGDSISNIRTGIAYSASGDTVLVQPGTYEERLDFYGRNITLGSLYLTTGDTSYISSTIIDGGGLGYPVVKIRSGEDSTAILTGFTIQNSANVSGLGGGIYCLNSSPLIEYNIITNNVARHGAGIYCGDADPLIRNNIIISNQAISEGGGISCLNSNPEISENIIALNTSDKGAGISCRYSYPEINLNSIEENEAVSEGGGVFCRDGSAPAIFANTFWQNIAVYGGAICSRYSSPEISQNEFAENKAVSGAGIYLMHSDSYITNNLLTFNLAESGGGLGCFSSDPQIVNNTFYGNKAGSLGPAINIINNSAPTIINCIVWGNNSNSGSEIYSDNPILTEISYSLIKYGWNNESDLSIKPMFRDSAGGDFHLMSVSCGDPYDSPCIDTGDPVIGDSLLNCSRGQGTALSDLGAYGGGSDIMLFAQEQDSRLPLNATIYNFPNPFNPQTTIEFMLGSLSDVKLTIYDITGAKVMALERSLDAGQHSIIWDAGDVVSGVYFARLETADYSNSIKMVLLK